MDATTEISVGWTYEYNDLNQLTKRYVGASWSVGTHRIEYEYDANGNLTRSVEETYSGVWSVSEEWQYDWNPRDQMTRAMKWAGSSGSGNNVGSVEYQYCLACDGALSKRFVYAGGSGASRGALQSGQRYEYDGLNLLRVDEIYGSTLSESGPWRTLEISTHQPGQLAALLHKRVYKYSSATSGSPSQTKDFTYSYDPVGNVYSVFDSNGNEAYYFTQDAFGNELPIATLGGDDWNDARADRIVEHQTGKWIDGFTGLYYFHARWYDSGVGRFVGRDFQRNFFVSPYDYCLCNPLNLFDPDGNAPTITISEESDPEFTSAFLTVYRWINKYAKQCCIDCWNKMDGVTIHSHKGKCSREGASLFQTCTGDKYLNQQGGLSVMAAVDRSSYSSITIRTTLRYFLGKGGLPDTLLHEMIHVCYGSDADHWIWDGDPDGNESGWKYAAELQAYRKCLAFNHRQNKTPGTNPRTGYPQ